MRTLHRFDLANPEATKKGVMDFSMEDDTDNMPRQIDGRALDEAVEIVPSDEKHSAGGLLSQPVGKLHVLFGLRPA